MRFIRLFCLLAIAGCGSSSTSSTIDAAVGGTTIDAASGGGSIDAAVSSSADARPAAIDAATSGSIDAAAPTSDAGGCQFAGGCTSCLTMRCGTQTNACIANSECFAIISCAQPCTDDMCRDACVAAHPNGQADFSAVSQCAATMCSDCCSG